MTLDELRRAVEALPPEASLTLAVAELREALNGGASHDAPVASTGGVRRALSASHDAPDRLLTTKAAAARLGTSVRYVYQHRGDFPFTRQLPGGAVRFSEAGLAAWLRRTR